MTIGRIPSVEGGIQPTIVDAKGDLIAGVAADSVNRLAVGSNDQVLVADSSTSTGLAWKSYGAQFVAGKNRLINGDFRINQRAFSSSTSAVYGFDRWVSGLSGGTVTYSAQTFTPGTAPVSGYEGINFARLDVTGQSAAGNYAFLAQRIEDVRTFAGQTVTVSFWAKAASGTPKVGICLEQALDGSSFVQTPVANPTISTSWARYSATVTLPSLSGKTLGAGNTTSLNLYLFTSAGSNLSAYVGSLGTQTATIDFWGVQLEAGSVATPFTTATGTIQGELAACQRYYWRWTPTNGSARFAIGGFANSTTTGRVMAYFPVTMRTVPSTSIDYSNMAVYDQTTVIACTALTADNPSTQTCNIDFTVASGGTAYRPVFMLANATSAAYVGFSAEL